MEIINNHDSGMFLTQNDTPLVKKIVFPKPKKFSKIFKFKRINITSNKKDKLNSVDLTGKGEIIFSMNKGIIGKVVKRKINSSSHKNIIKTYSKELIFQGNFL